MKRRNTNLEILRIICMLFIIIWHSTLHGNLYKSISFNTSDLPNFIGITFLIHLVYIAVNCYVLISGFFAIDFKFKIEKAVKLWLQVFFYSILIYLISVFALDLEPLSLSKLIKACLPISSGKYWFMTSFFALYLLSPFLVILIKSLNRENHRTLLIISFFLFSILQIRDVFGGSDLIWFVFLYLLASYVRIYNPFEKYQKHALQGYLFISILGTLLYIGYSWSKIHFGIRSESEIHPYFISQLFQYNGPLLFLSSLFFFISFARWIPKENILTKGIITIAPYSLGVYLIHDNNSIREYIWDVVVQPTLYADKAYLIPMLILFAILIYIACSIIDAFREKLFSLLKPEVYITKALKSVSQRISKTPNSHAG